MRFRVEVEVKSKEIYYVDADSQAEAEERFEDYLRSNESEFVEEGGFSDAVPQGAAVFIQS